MFNSSEIIAAYTRRQAIEDGVLVDVTEAARGLGFRVPVAMTSAAFAKFVRETNVICGMEEPQRLGFFLSMLFVVLIESRHRVGPDVYRWECQEAKDPSTRRTVVAKVVRGPDDDGDECLTVMLKDED